MTSNNESNTSPTNLDEMVATTCFCKLRETCNDKNSSECMRHRNIYAEFMQQKREETPR
jgi:hypothetical protein